MAAPFDPARVTAPAPRAHGLDPDSVHQFVSELIGDDLHAARVLSLANGVVGVLHTTSLAIHAIGEALAQARALTPKHAIKQIDRTLSNSALDPERLTPQWVAFVLGTRTEAVVAMDWTDFDGDGQTTLVLNLITTHGRATPLLWKTVLKSGLKAQRNDHEDALLRRLHEALPEGVRLTVLADRGFGDQKLYAFLGAEVRLHHPLPRHHPRDLGAWREPHGGRVVAPCDATTTSAGPRQLFLPVGAAET